MLTLTALTLNGVVAASVLQTSVIDTVPEVSHATGGQVMESLGGKKVSSRLADLIDQIRTRYALGYHPAGTQASGKFHEIRLQLWPEIEKREGRLIVRTRHGYYR